MSIPERILLDYIIHIAISERRPISFKDCMLFEFKEQGYRMTYGTFRNKISILIKNGKVKKIYHSNIAFYAPVGYDVAGREMTDNGAGVSTNSPIHELITNAVLDKNAIHDIRLKFGCKNIWNIISFIIENKYDILVSNKISTFCNNDIFSTTAIDNPLPDAINPQSKDIYFKPWETKGFKIDITVHRTDTATIIIGCSYNPLFLDFKGYIDFSNLLTRIEERLVRLVNDCSLYYMKIQKGIKSNNDNNNIVGNNTNGDHMANITTINDVFIKIPSHENWIVTMWHFGADSLTSYQGERFYISISNLNKTVYNIYSKKFGKKQKIRIERQEYPNKPIQEVIDDKLNNNI